MRGRVTRLRPPDVRALLRRSRARRSCRGAAGSGRVTLTEHQVLRPSPRDRGAILEPVPEHAADHKPTAEGADRVRHPRPGRGDVPVRPHRRVHARSPPAGGHTPTEIYETPATPEVAGFIGRCNLLEGRVDSTEGGPVQTELGETGQPLRVARVCSAGSSATVGLRSERITLTDRADAPHDGAVNVLRARIEQCSYTGARFEYELSVGGLRVHAERPARHTEGETNLIIRPNDCLLAPRTSLTRTPAAAGPVGFGLTQRLPGPCRPHPYGAGCQKGGTSPSRTSGVSGRFPGGA
ncbi:TOBE domain-containing protein [Streptomyces rochei]|uniref:TOBE domain-containing protein n=1 Tax=Streptomyces TaxID=1883 RepID=UPI0035CC7C9D